MLLKPSFHRKTVANKMQGDSKTSVALVVIGKDNHKHDFWCKMLHHTAAALTPTQPNLRPPSGLLGPHFGVGVAVGGQSGIPTPKGPKTQIQGIYCPKS